MVSQVVGFLQSASHWRGQPTCEMGHKPTGFATIEAMKHVSPYRNSRLAIILFATALIILWGNAAMAMILNSRAFQQNGHIPSKYTCEGEDVSPPLAWEGVPNGAKSLVLIIDDPDAPDPKAPPFRSLFQEVQRTFEDFSRRTPFMRFGSDMLSPKID